MTRIIEFLIAVGIVAGLFIIVALLLPSQRTMTESIETNRKMTIVYDTLNGMQRFKDWNPLMLHDPQTKLTISGPDAGKGARLDYQSDEHDVGKGSWEIISSEPNKQIVIAVTNPQRGEDKKITFDLEGTGKGNRNVKITQTYDLDYKFDLMGRYDGLYVSRGVGEDLKMGLARLTNTLTTVPNIDYNDADLKLGKFSIVDLPAEDLLVVNAGNIEKSYEVLMKQINGNLEWIKRVMDKNNLETAGPVRIITLDLGENYAFEVAQPVRKKVAAAKAPAKGKTPEATPAPAAPTEALAIGTVNVEGTPVEFRSIPARRAATTQFTGQYTTAVLGITRDALRSWALTKGHEVAGLPYENWNSGVKNSFEKDDSVFDVYWILK